MKNCSFKWLLSTMLLITTAFVLSSLNPTIAAPSLPKTTLVVTDITPTPLKAKIDQTLEAIGRHQLLFGKSEIQQNSPTLYQKTNYTQVISKRTVQGKNYRATAYHRMMGNSSKAG